MRVGIRLEHRPIEGRLVGRACPVVHARSRGQTLRYFWVDGIHVQARLEADVLNKLPKSQQPKAKRALQDIWMAETKPEALVRPRTRIAARSDPPHRKRCSWPPLAQPCLSGQRVVRGCGFGLGKERKPLLVVIGAEKRSACQGSFHDRGRQPRPLGVGGQRWLVANSG